DVCDRYSDVGVPKQHKDDAISCNGAGFCLNDDQVQELGGDLVVDEGENCSSVDQCNCDHEVVEVGEIPETSRDHQGKDGVEQQLYRTAEGCVETLCQVLLLSGKEIPAPSSEALMSVPAPAKA
uniref:Uncharacterized protein n=1 Tax=Romanomermis culicivorax TaxID=13658 RepID=A0A915J3Q8_ROMCU